MRLNIFDQLKNIEMNYAEEMERVRKLFSEIGIIRRGINSYSSHNIEDYVNEKWFLGWEPFRGNFLTIKEMRSALNISDRDIVSNDQATMINFFEFVFNIIKLARQKMYHEIFDGKYYNILISNINNALDKINYKIEDLGDYAIVIEKDPKAIAVGELYEDISENIIEYRRFAIQGNIERKKEILATLSKKIEAVESNLKQNQYAYLIDEVTGLLNSLDIRHNNKEGKYAHAKIIDMPPQEQEEWCDRTYDTILLALMINHYLEYKKDIKTLNKELKVKTQ